MENTKKLEMLEEMLDVDAGTLTPETKLEALTEWDSMAKLSLIVLMDEEFDKHLTSTEIKTFETIGDILAFMEA